MIIPTKQFFVRLFFASKLPPPSLEIASRLFRRPSDASKELRCSLFSLSYFLFQEQSQIYVHQAGATSEGRFHKMKMSYFFRCANRKCAFKFFPFAKKGGNYLLKNIYRMCVKLKVQLYETLFTKKILSILPRSSHFFQMSTPFPPFLRKFYVVPLLFPIPILLPHKKSKVEGNVRYSQ